MNNSNSNSNNISESFYKEVDKLGKNIQLQVLRLRGDAQQIKNVVRFFSDGDDCYAADRNPVLKVELLDGYMCIRLSRRMYSRRIYSLLQNLDATNVQLMWKPNRLNSSGSNTYEGRGGIINNNNNNSYSYNYNYMNGSGNENENENEMNKMTGLVQHLQQLLRIIFERKFSNNQLLNYILSSEVSPEISSIYVQLITQTPYCEQVSNAVEISLKCKRNHSRQVNKSTIKSSGAPHFKTDKEEEEEDDE